jgi:hypothetical protein
MFELNVDEYEALRCQIGTLKTEQTNNVFMKKNCSGIELTGDSG